MLSLILGLLPSGTIPSRPVPRGLERPATASHRLGIVRGRNDTPMGWQTVLNIRDFAPVKGADYMVLLALAIRADDKNICWPGMSCLAKDTRMSKRQIVRSIDALVRAGLVKVVEKATYTTSTKYEIMAVGQVTHGHQGGVTPSLGEMTHGHPGGDTRSSGVVTHSQQGGDRVSPKTTEKQQRAERLAPAQRQRSSSTRGLSSFQRSAGDKKAGSAGAVLKRQNNDAKTAWSVAQLLGERGCDQSFRTAYKQIAPLKVVQQIAAEFDQHKANIRNPGGWWRRKLRAAGVEV